MKCMLCNKELKDTFQALGNHLHLTHKDFDKKVYYDTYLKTNQDGICKICKKPTSFIDIINGYKKYCSLECEQKDNPNIKYTICKICGDYTNARGFGSHITCKHKISLQEYYDTYIKCENEGLCIICSKPTKFISITKGYEKYCSAQCKSSKSGRQIIHCEICNNDFTADSIISHLLSHKLTSQEYYDTYLKKNDEGFCKVCGNVAQYISITQGYSNYCSIDCKAKDNNKEVCICKICEEHFISNNLLAKHIKNMHKISQKQYYDTYMKKEGEGICVVCGKPTRFVTFVLGYSKHCSRACQANDTTIKEKMKQTSIKQYGGVGFASSKISNKIKQTNLKKYGCEYAFQSDEIKDKIKQNNLKKYGVEYTGQRADVQENIKKTIKQRYGVDYAFQSKEIYNKGKQTKLNRYGDENYNNVEKLKETLANRTPEEIQAINEKIKKTNMERYGVSSAWHSPQAREAMKKKYGVEYGLQSKEIYEKTLDTQEKLYGNRYAITTPSIKQKAKETLQEHFGVENTWESPEIREKSKQTKEERYGNPEYTNPEKAKQTNLERYGITNTFNLPNIRKITSSLEVRQKAIESTKVTWEQQGGHPMTRQDIVDKFNETRQQNNKLDKELGDADE